MRNCKNPTGASSCSGVICVFSMENCKFSQVDSMLIPIGEGDSFIEVRVQAVRLKLRVRPGPLAAVRLMLAL